jgi:HipA-like protein
MQYSFKVDYTKVKAIKIFLEFKTYREYVGRLLYKNGNYILDYDDKYLGFKKAIPVGPELPLTKRQFVSEKLFPSFEDRIPSRKNPAYPDYCRLFGINVDESNAIILLATIGRKGPSSLIYEPDWGITFTAQDLKIFRTKLGLSTRDFAKCFGFSQASIVRIENNESSGETILRLVEIFDKFPEVAIHHILLHADQVHSKKKLRVIERLRHSTQQDN